MRHYAWLLFVQFLFSIRCNVFLILTIFWIAFVAAEVCFVLVSLKVDLWFVYLPILRVMINKYLLNIQNWVFGNNRIMWYMAFMHCWDKFHPMLYFPSKLSSCTFSKRWFKKSPYLHVRVNTHELSPILRTRILSPCPGKN